MNATDCLPCNVETLQKGDVIPADRLEVATGVVRTDPRYGVKLLKIRERIRKELARRARILTIRRVGFDLKVLTDAEAHPYNREEGRRGRRKDRRAFVRQSAVDATALPANQRPEYERDLHIQSLYIQAQNTVRRAIAMQAVVRTVPGLPPSEKHPVRETAGMRDGDVMPINERRIQSVDGPSGANCL